MMTEHSEQPAGAWVAIKGFFGTLALAGALLFMVFAVQLALDKNSLFYMGLALLISFGFCKEIRQNRL